MPSTTSTAQPTVSTTTPDTSTTTSVEETTTSTRPATTTTLPPLQGLSYVEVAELSFPIDMVAWRDGFSLVATKDGQVYLLEPAGELRDAPILDIAGQVHNEGERGLLGIAVHEDMSRVFLHYSANGGDTTVSVFDWDGSALVDERVLLRVDQPAGNHNGGMIQFGPDGALYLGLGDGGGANDRFGHGQNRDSLLGGLVRIDVDASEPTAELYQYGLRNPWRFWIDRAGDDLIYIADVGQNSLEEVSVAPLVPDVNYGWPITEGFDCFRPSSGCGTSGLTLPLIDVSHGDAGTCSITGGIVYRGSAIPELEGHFFYSDFCGGYLRSFRHEDGAAVDQTDWTDQVGVPGSVASFGVDPEGEMYVLTTNRILKVMAER